MDKVVYKTEVVKDHQKWLQKRDTGIGGSDAASAIGKSRYKSKLRLFYEKTGKIPKAEPTQKMLIGKLIEDSIFKMVKMKHKEYEFLRNNRFYRSTEYPWMIANIDGDIFDSKADGPGVLEIKFTSPFASQWKNGEIPEEYIIQIHHYFIVTGRSWGMIAYLVGNELFDTYYIYKDEQLCKKIIEKEKDFWHNHVLKNVPPEPDHLKDTEELFNELYAATNGEKVKLPDSVETAIDELKELKKKKKEIEKEIQFRKNIIRNSLENYEYGETSRYKIYTEKRTQRRFDVKRFQKEKKELYQKYLYETASDYLQIKRKREE